MKSEDQALYQVSHTFPLPEELVLRVLGFSDYATVLIITQVSKELSRIASDGALWRLLFEKDLVLLPFVQNTTFMMSKPTMRTTVWKEFYYESHFKQKPKYQTMPPAIQSGSPASFVSSFSRTQRSRILYIGPKHAGKSKLFYHLKFGTSFQGIYYLRKFGTVVSIDLNVGTSKNKLKQKSTPEAHFTTLSADLEVWDAEDFEDSPFRRTHTPEGVIIVIDSEKFSSLSPFVIQHLQLLQSTPHIGEGIPFLVLATRWNVEGATRAATVAHALGLQYTNSRAWRVQPCCTTTLLGVKEGLQWLHTEMREKKSWES